MYDYPKEIKPFKRTHLYHDTRKEADADSIKRYWGSVIIVRYTTPIKNEKIYEAKIDLSPNTGNYFICCGEVDPDLKEFERKYALKMVVESEERAKDILFSWIKENKLKTIFDMV